MQREPKSPKTKRDLVINIQALKCGYLIRANTGLLSIFGISQKLAAVTTKQEVVSTVTEIVLAHLP